jgi:Mlc titration factor MtfA (ptsG expression regulator)
VLQALRSWRRNRILRQAPIDDAQWQDLVSHFPFAWSLAPADQERLRELVVLFLHEKHFSAAAGLQLGVEMQLWVAIQACILVLNLDLDYYRGWSGIILYPEQFVPRHQQVDETGIVHEGDEPYGVNVVIHEFAHKLDMLNGDANGFPPLHASMSRAQWSEAFSAAYADFCRRVDGAEDTEIDPYASESAGEFFAVLSEAFFEIPDVVQDEYPQVYAQLAAFYRQDPAERLMAAAVRLPG